MKAKHAKRIRANHSAAAPRKQLNKTTLATGAGAINPPRHFKFSGQPKEWKVVALRECPVDNPLLDTPALIEDYWRKHVASHPYFSQEVESFVVVILNVRRHVIGHCLVSTGLVDTILAHPRETFRTAIVACASAIVLTHNHPSGDPTPSESDIRMTRDMIRAGRLLKIEVLDHVIMGRERHASLREMGYFNDAAASREAPAEKSAEGAPAARKGNARARKVFGDGSWMDIRRAYDRFAIARNRAERLIWLSNIQSACKAYIARASYMTENAEAR